MRKSTFLFTVCALVMISNNHFSQVKTQEQQKSQDGSEPGRVLIAPALPSSSATLIGSPAMRMPGGTILPALTEMNFGRMLVKGAPFSADAVMESIQVLTDGNRIVNTTSSGLYRDSEGRTRVERSRLLPGRQVENPDLFKLILISDPVSKENHTLQPHSQTATKTPYFQVPQRIIHPGVQSVPLDEAKAALMLARTKAQREASATANKTPGGSQQATPADRNTSYSYSTFGDPSGTVSNVLPVQAVPSVSSITTAGNRESKEESLGKQMIEGVEAEGTRTTQTIPAGTIGNERPIEIVSERWYSPELQVVVLIKQTDPRSGESVYRLTNINRSEPDPSLFQVPSNYTIQEPPTFDIPVAPVLRKKDDQ